MGFIQKFDPVVVNIKLTTKGRELLSGGRLKFSKYVVGDSEINYNIAKDSDPVYNLEDLNILRPFDINPPILSPIPKYFGASEYNELGYIPFNEYHVVNTKENLGYFDIDSGFTGSTLDNTIDNIRQADIQIETSTVLGENILSIKKSSTYGTNLNEPVVGDILMVRWSISDDTTNDTIIDPNKPYPILFYKILTITGTLASDTLVVTVDRKLPNLVGTNVLAGCVIFNHNFEDQYIDDFITGAKEFPYWKLSIIYSENIPGVDSALRQYYQHETASYVGFLNYIQSQVIENKVLGVIHYTNQTPLNTYGEELNVGEVIVPTLKLPTIMWHKSPTLKMGLEIKSIGSLKTYTSNDSKLMTTFYNLSDNWGNIVGKVFIDLKLFVIEDQELLNAMSYKSNRSWTLPNYKLTLSRGEYDCPTCAIDFELEVVDK